MIDGNRTALDWRALIESRLQTLIAPCERGIDVAPAQRHRFEGYLRALVDAGAEPLQLVEYCRQRLPSMCTIEFDTVGGEFIVSLPQARAPVYPSTRD